MRKLPRALRKNARHRAARDRKLPWSVSAARPSARVKESVPSGEVAGGRTPSGQGVHLSDEVGHLVESALLVDPGEADDDVLHADGS